MSENDVLWQERRLEEILYSSADPLKKVQHIIKLGFEPEAADQIVERHQIGLQTPMVYYERLDFDGYEQDQEYKTERHIR